MSDFRTTDDDLSPTNAKLVTPLLTDMYQISMTYAHWKGGRVNDHAVFDLFFRKCPFKGEFALFCGLEEVLRFCHSFRFSESDIVYLKKLMPAADPEFFVWLSQLTCSEVKLYSHREGSIVFPREPLIRVEGPLGITQLLETTLLTLVNFPSLIATNAARMRIAAGPKAECLEFGLRRAQGPDGGISASRYAIMGGFHGTSNVAAGSLFGMDVKGTHAHAYVMSYTGLKDLRTRRLQPAGGGEKVDFVALVLSKRSQLYGGHCTSSDSEMAAFISFAQAFPDGVLALVDTYDTLKSGVPNFISVGLALHDLGYKPRGIRLDSGDLAYLSREARKLFHEADAATGKPVFRDCKIVASNDLDEDTLLGLAVEGHEIDVFGIGTNLVTCLKQPALGCVFKLVEINAQARIKLSEGVEKVVIPGRKAIYRLVGTEGHALFDIIQGVDEPAPVQGERILCRHPFAESKRAIVTPSRVECLLNLVFDGSLGHDHDIVVPLPPLQEIRSYVEAQIKSMRSDHVRSTSATQYKVAVSNNLYTFMHQLWLENAPISEIS